MSFPTLPNYEILREIGEGGMGIVYLGRHRITQRLAAIKVLHYHLARDPQFRTRFENEARMMADLKHPNIVEWFDFYELPNTTAMIMEYVEGRTLDQMIGRETGPIPYERAIPLFVQLLEGVAYAHEKNIIHRDIKPSNILVTKENILKITDFGIAKIAGVKGVTKTGTKVGTLYYMSPEQLQGKEVDARSDVYSLGVTLYEMVAGQLPFKESDTEFMIMKKVVEENFPKPTTFYPAIPEPIEQVVMQAISKTPEDRFNSCKAFKQALQKAVERSNTAEREREEKIEATIKLTKTTAAMVEEHPKLAPTNVTVKKQSKKLWIMVVAISISLAIILFFYNSSLNNTDIRYAKETYQKIVHDGWSDTMTVDYDKITRAANHNNAKGQFVLGLMYAEGRGVPQDDTQAVHWYRKAAEQGNAKAQTNLGLMYAEGRGVPQDVTQAVHWYRKAAEQGDASAQFALGRMYEYGRGVPQDDTQAVHWYRKAAEQGLASAQFYLGFMYFIGIGVPQDYAQAVHWFRKAAEQGNATAQYFLGLMYESGSGVRQDFSQAVYWYRKAAEQGNETAKKRLRELGYIY